MEVAQLRRGLLAMGIPYMSTEQVERLAHLIDTDGRGKVIFKDFAAKFRPGQLKFGWLEEALKVVGSSFVTKRRGGQVEKDAEKERTRASNAESSVQSMRLQMTEMRSKQGHGYGNIAKAMGMTKSTVRRIILENEN